MLKYKFIYFIIIFSILNANSFKDKLSSDDSVGVILKAGTLGLGFDFEYIHNSFLGIRANFNGIAYKNEGILEENEYNYLLDLKSMGVLIDYHPFHNAFRFSFGLYDNLSKIDAKLKPSSGDIVVGNNTYKSRQIGNIKTNIDFNRKNPYLGIGFSSTNIKGFYFTLDLGALYIGTPKATITATAAKGYEGLQDILDNEAKIEEEKINKDIAKYKYYPVISVGLQYKF